ncbi:MAG: DEAD/DEAH box helicase [Candidatus Aenigmarchaeota archaeon]|nr:DEAD/DEAH box helicase [Candidatus Aenigmarchaeota archaeon]
MLQIAVCMLKDFTPRLYQETILNTCTTKNTLVVLPTGLGKTAIAMMLAAQRLSQYPQSKIVFLAPTKPLCDQHYNSFLKYLEAPKEKMAVFTGEIPPDVRAGEWENLQFIFSTPQGLENDVLGSKISLKNVSLLVVDEAHRAVGDYSYCWVAKQYNRTADFPRILALTASPGSELEKIHEVCSNLFIEGVEIRTESDSDVAPYVQPITMQWRKVELPPAFVEIKKQLDVCIKNKLQEIKQLGFIKITDFVTKKEILGLTAALQQQMASGNRSIEILRALSLNAEVMKAHHALELLETQGIASLQKYFEKIFSEAQVCKTKAVKNLVTDVYFKAASIKTRTLFEQKIEHPKLAEACKIVQETIEADRNAKIILFTQYRDTAVMVENSLKKMPQIVPAVFVGQARKGTTGLSQKKQIEMLEQFRDGLYNVLIATSVAEEGLDIPSVDLVLFYEPIPSAIRHIQRRGRTGRQEKGRVMILVAKGTRDEAYSFSAKRKEMNMKSFLTSLKKSIPAVQPTISSFMPENKIKLFADFREKGSGVLKILADMGVELKLDMLQSADYVLSSRVGVEFKTIPDFVDSIIDGRLLAQLKELKHNFERPIILLEGKEDLYAVRNIHPNAIRGMLATISASYGIPILHSKYPQESAELLLSIAKREQEEGTKDFSYHADKKPMTLTEQQEYLISCLPNVGPQLAKSLLTHFGSIRAVVNAAEEQLKEVDGVGEKIAKGIKELSGKEYKKII